MCGANGLCSNVQQYPYVPVFSPMDVNGDGITDFVSNTLSVKSKYNHADLLAAVDNGRGGTIQIAYEADLLQRDDVAGGLEEKARDHAEAALLTPGTGDDWQAEPLGPDPVAPSVDDRARWSSRAVVSSVTVSGHGFDPATTTYRYADPRWCPAHRMSFGFRLVERTRPDASVVERYFWQKHGRTGRTADLIVSETSGGQEMYRGEEDWDLPQGPIPGSIQHPEVFVGRRVFASSANRYAGGVGAGMSRTLTYDDSYGYHFVSRIDEERPTGELTTLLTPEPATAGGVVGLVQSVETQDAGGVQLARSVFTYTPEGAVDTRTDFVEDRGAVGTGRAIVTDLAYDARGNPVQLTEQISDTETRDTYFCYDGTDAAYHASCPTFTGIPETFGVRTGVVDALGNLTTFEPDSASGRIVRIDSFYDDEPASEFLFDAFSRRIEEKLTPLSGTTFTAREIVYDDGEPFGIEIRDYTGNGGEFIRTARVSDGFGGEWKTTEETPGDTVIEYVGRATYRVPDQSLVRETYDQDCGTDDLCAGVTGASEVLATEIVSDALGRPISVTTPDGTARRSYRPGSRSQPAGPGTGSGFDVVLASSGKGDLTERWLDGDRVVWVEECDSVVAPGAAIDMASCTGADTTLYTYEASGEVSTVFDAIATSSAGYADPHHYLRYHYDTLGRIVQVDDPDGGTSSTDYDDAGNVAATTNARGQQTLYAYDLLDRPTDIGPLANGQPIRFTYRASELQRESEFALSQQATPTTYRLSYEYDPLGRLGRKTHEGLDGAGATQFTLLMDFAYDDLGRTTQIVYPDDETVVSYEYEGAYLARVCEVDAPGETCADPGAVPYVSEITYDELGRRAQVSMPPGDRTYQYSNATRRLTRDAFASVGSGYAIERNYGTHTAVPGEVDYAYDEVGNLVLMTGGTSQGGSPIAGDPTIDATYTYDRRNRIASWTRSATEHFSYDPLGNLVGYATASAGAQNQLFGEASGKRPHAVTSSSASGASVAFTYDADGNRASEVGGGTSRYYSFDWAHRLVGVGTAPGGSGLLSVGYDASGSRIWEWTTANGLRVFFDEHVTFKRGESPPSGFDAMQIRIFAFGETLAVKQQNPVTLRTVGAAGWMPLPRAERWLPWVLALALAFGAGGALLLLVRLGIHLPVVRHPATAGAAWALVVLIALPPLPAGSGGGGGTTLRRWLVTDHLGSGVVWLDSAGARIRHTEYAPFGRVDAEVAPGGSGLPTIYAGHRREAITGLDYMQARWYASETGTFLSIDPVVADAADPQAYNAYAYARNNPIRYTDPTGTHFQFFLEGAGPDLVGGVFAPSTSIAPGGGYPGPLIFPDVPMDIGHGAKIDIVEKDGRYFLEVSPLEEQQQDTTVVAQAKVRSLEEIRALNDWGLNTLPPIDPEMAELYERTMILIPAEGAAAAAGKAAARMGRPTRPVPKPVRKPPGEYINGEAPHQVAPGTRVLEGQKISDKGRVERWKAHYDEYGRLKARTDYNASNKAAGIPHTHHHTYEWGPGKSPMETGSHIPGEYLP